MKILVTGINGFVGHYMISELHQHFPSAAIVGVGRQAKSEMADYYIIDLNNSVEVKNILHRIKPDMIVHLAAVSSVGDSWKKPGESFKNNVNIYLNIIEGVRKLNLKTRILSVGSSEQYGIVKKEKVPISENCELNPINPYAIARVTQEMLAKLYVDSFGLDIVCTRSFNHFGPRQESKFVISSFAKQFAEIKLGKRAPQLDTGELSIIRDFLDVRDVVNAYCLLLRKGSRGAVYNICSGTGYSLQQIVTKLKKIANIDVTQGINKTLIRPNDNLVIIGDNTKFSSLCNWSPNYSIDESLTDLFLYWLEEIKSPKSQNI